MMDSSAANAMKMKILVVDDDSTCLSVVAAVLRKFHFQVVTVKDPMEALNILGGVEGGFDVVIADVHMPEMNGFQLQQQITTDFQLPVILMSVDERDNLVGRGVDFGATLFISKPVSVNDVRNYLWQITAAAAVSKKDNQNSNIIPPPPDHDQATATATAAAPTRRPSTDNPAAANTNNNSEITREGELTFKTHKLTGKKKLVWTATLHYKFLDAITIIGLNNAVPKKILEVMDVPGITREHVASHLQKYRMFLRRVSELTMPRQRNIVDYWGFGSGVNYLGPRIGAPRRYGGGMFSLINNQTSLGGWRWKAEEQPPHAAGNFLFSHPPRLDAAAAASLLLPNNNQPPSWWRPGYGGHRQSSLLLSPHHQQQLFNFGLLQSSLIPTNMVNRPIYQRSFTSLPPLVIRGNNAAASLPAPTLQLQDGGGSRMLQPPQTYNNNNNTNTNTAAETSRNIEIMVRGAAAAETLTRPNQLSGRRVVDEELPPRPDPLNFDFVFNDDDDDVFKFLLSDPTENQSYSDDASQNSSRPITNNNINTCTEGHGGNLQLPFSPLFVPDPVQPQTDDLTPPPSHPLLYDGIIVSRRNNTTGGDNNDDENTSLLPELGLTTPLSTKEEFSMSFFAADHHQLDGGGLATGDDHHLINSNNNDYEYENSNFQYYDHQDLPSLDQLLLEPRNDEGFIESMFASMPFMGGAQQDHQNHTSKN